MAFTESIAKYLNDSLKASSLNFNAGLFHTMATVIARKQDNNQLQLLPGIADVNGNYKTIEPNDKLSLIVYHKSLSTSYNYAKQDSYGNNYDLKATNEVAMIIWANAKKIKLSDEQLETRIIASFPQQLSAETKSSLQFKSCLISPLQTDMDKVRVFRQEYPGVNYFLRPEHIFFQLKYRVEIVFTQDCITCGCVTRIPSGIITEAGQEILTEDGSFILPE